MTKKLTMIHTVASIVPSLMHIAQEIMPDVAISNTVDESILKNLIVRGALTADTHRAVCNLVIAAELSGADMVLVTCSSISPCVDIAQALVDIPVLNIDEPMVLEALAHGNRIGVAATLQTTLAPTISQLEQHAQQQQKTIKIQPALCKGAFEAVVSGDVQMHDKIVLEQLVQLGQTVDCIVLAQASMARLVEQLPQEMTIPILSSPRSGIAHAHKVLVS